MNLYEKIINLNLKEMEPVTLVIRDQGGNLLILKKKWYRVEPLIPYEDAPDEVTGVNLTIRNLGKDANFRFTDYPVQYFQELIIYKGHIDIDINIYKYVVKEKPDETIRYLKYPNYSSQPFREIAADFPDYIFYKE